MKAEVNRAFRENFGLRLVNLSVISKFKYFCFAITLTKHDKAAKRLIWISMKENSNTTSSGTNSIAFTGKSHLPTVCSAEFRYHPVLSPIIAHSTVIQRAAKNNPILCGPALPKGRTKRCSPVRLSVCAVPMIFSI